MSSFIFASDLDGTIIHSRRNQRDDDACVELINDEPWGFMRPTVLTAIRSLPSNVIFSIVTTRSIEQFSRIDWLARCPDYAYVANGAILLADGSCEVMLKDGDISERVGLLDGVVNVLVNERGVRTARVVNECYVIALLENSEAVPHLFCELAVQAGLNLFVEGKKAYLFPSSLSKAIAIHDLRRRYPGRVLVCAGDSSNDIPMLRFADVAITIERVANLLTGSFSHNKILSCSNNTSFEDFVGECIKELSKLGV